MHKTKIVRTQLLTIQLKRFNPQSRMDTEDASNNNHTHIFNTSDVERTEHSHVIWEVRVFLELFTLITLISIIVNILIVFTILKFRKLRQQVTYIIIVHLSVVEGVYMCCTPLTLRVLMELQFVTDIHMIVFCILSELESAIFGAIGLSLLLLICDWYIKVYTSEHKYKKFSRVYKFFLAFIYLFVIFAGSVTIRHCSEWFYSMIFTLITVLVFVVIVIILIAMNIVHRIKRRNLVDPDKINNTGLTIANIFISAWIPTIFLLILTYTGIQPPLLMLIICAALAFTSPVLNFVYLYTCDGQFNLFFKAVARCRCSDYQNEDLDCQSVIYNGNSANVVNI